jgi:signal peptidase I
MKSLPFVLSVDEEDSTVGSVDIYPSMMADKWNNDFYGPITVPKKGEKIYINDSMLNFYGEVIKKYEGNTDVVVRADRLYVDGQHVKEYTFRQDYYFMMGDNRHNSLDSRYWGFVPEDHILGKPLFIWFSFDSEANLLHKVRWRRLFTWIE